MRTIHTKKQAPPPLNYLEKEEMKAILAAPDQRDPRGFRDYSLLLFLYNTGARATEAVLLKAADLDLLSSKGRKDRCCPLWKETTAALRQLVAQRGATQSVFCNAQGQALTRFDIHTLVERHTLKASTGMSTLQTKSVSPHTIRHTTAMHLLRSGVDINTIRVWLGHVSLQTTHIYAESDLNMKAKALAQCEAPLLQTGKMKSAQKGLMGFLKGI